MKKNWKIQCHKYHKFNMTNAMGQKQSGKCNMANTMLQMQYDKFNVTNEIKDTMWQNLRKFIVKMHCDWPIVTIAIW